MAEKLPIFDGHNDVLLNLYMPERGHGRDFFQRSEIGHIDLPRALEGRLAGGLFAIFVPADPNEPKLEPEVIIKKDSYEVPYARAIDPFYAQQTTMAMMTRLFQIEQEAEGKIKVVRTVPEIRQCLETGTLAIVLHFEGAEVIDPELTALNVFYQAGLRSLGLVWSRPNIFASGVPFKFPASPDTGPGLTDLGEKLVRGCNQRRILIDLAHINERGFWDIASITDAPLVVSHSAVHAISPSARNLTDKQLDAIKESHGIVGLNFSVHDIRPDGDNNPNTPLSLMVRHINYLAERIGIEHIGFGSDLDGTHISQEIGDVAGLPNLVNALRAEGYNETELRKITLENWLRVLDQTWQ